MHRFRRRHLQLAKKAQAIHAVLDISTLPPKPPLESIQLIAWQSSGMLQLTNNNAWRNAQAARKSNDAFRPERQSSELGLKGSRNQEIFGEFVRFLFLSTAQHLCRFNEQRVWIVQKEVCCLMEEREPEVVVGQISEAQKQQRLAWRHESGGSAGAAAGWGTQYHDRDSSLRTYLLQRWKKSCRVLLSCQWPNSRQSREKLVAIPWLAMDVATRNLSLA
jgi:hypothetical protein